MLRKNTWKSSIPKHSKQIGIARIPNFDQGNRKLAPLFLDIPRQTIRNSIHDAAGVLYQLRAFVRCQLLKKQATAVLIFWLVALLAQTLSYDAFPQI